MAVDSLYVHGAWRRLSRGLPAEPLSFTPHSWDAAPGQLLLSAHSWGLFTVAMVTFISIAAALLFLRGE